MRLSVMAMLLCALPALAWAQQPPTAQQPQNQQNGSIDPQELAAQGAGPVDPREREHVERAAQPRAGVQSPTQNGLGMLPLSAAPQAPPPQNAAEDQALQMIERGVQLLQQQRNPR